MYNKDSLAISAISNATITRLELGINDDTPINIYNIIEEKQIDLWFVDITSMEGIFYNDKKPTILISSHRPKGRRVFTSAHEFAHFVYGHSSRVDELKGNSNKFQPEEFIADVFAGELLMPRNAIINFFKDRNWDVTDPNPKHFFSCSSHFGVGYESLLNQVRYSFKLINETNFKLLQKYKLPQIKLALINEQIESDLIIIDHKSKDNVVDAEVGDFVITPKNSVIQGNSAVEYKELESNVVFKVTKPGINLFINEKVNLSKFIRVQKNNYCGRNRFRHLEEVENGNN